MSRVKKCHCQSCDRIVPRMSEDSSAKISSEESEQTEEGTEHGEHEHRACTLVAMRGAEDHRREHYACDGSTFCPSGELSLQIPAKYKLFRNTY